MIKGVAQSTVMYIELFFLFLARTIDMSLGTLRHVFVVQGRKYPAAAVGFVEIAVYTVALGLVVSAADEPLRLLVFSAGFAAGIICGVSIEERLALGHRSLQVIVDEEAFSFVEESRLEGHPATVWKAEGRDGVKLVINLLLTRREALPLAKRIRERMPAAFVLLSETKYFMGGRVGGRAPALTDFPLRCRA
jgi:uncharacterized protein YebE (UPF0316 family)